MPTSTIKSAQNSQFKQWRRFAHHPEDETCPWLPLAGAALEDQARRRRVQILFHSEARGPEPWMESADRIVVLPSRLLSLLSGLSSPPRALGFVDKPSWTWDQLPDWLLVAAGIQDPGNLGTLVRTANATGKVGLASLAGTVSFFNEKVVRATSGTLFSTPFMPGASPQGLRERGWRLVAVSRGRGKSLFETELEAPSAFLLGAEGQGLDEQLTATVDEFVHIPVAAGVDSLNVAVAGALIAYEIFRRGTRD